MKKGLGIAATIGSILGVLVAVLRLTISDNTDQVVDTISFPLVAKIEHQRNVNVLATGRFCLASLGHASRTAYAPFALVLVKRPT